MRRVTALIALAALVACDKSGLGTAGKASAVDSIAALNSQLTQAHTVAAQQDSLMQGFTATTQLLDDIDRDLTKVKGLKSHVPLDVKAESAADPKAAYRAALLGKVQEVTRLLDANRRRVRELAAGNSVLQKRIAQYDSTISALQGMVDRQKTEIADLTGRVDSLTTANTQLASDKAAVTDTMQSLRKENNTVYYVIGSKDDLKKRGLIVEEGSKFLFFGHKALVPARALDESQFTAVDKFTVTTITLPDSAKKFQIVSRQDPSLVQEGTAADGKPTGVLTISNPTQFWTPSKFLIIVQ